MKETKTEFPPELIALAVECGEVVAWYRDLKRSGSMIMRSENFDHVLGLKRKATLTFEEWVRHVHPEDVALFEKSMSDLVHGRAQTFDLDYRIIGDDDRTRWLHSHGRAFLDSDGGVVRVAGASTNITEKKELERTRDRFIATLSHDLRNPLAAAKANIDLIGRLPAALSEQKNLPRKAIMEIDRADRIIQDLLDLERIKAGQHIYVRWQDCDLRKIFQNMVEALSLQYGHRFHLDAPDALQGRWPTDIILRVIENLATNAVKYSAGNRVIFIRVEVHGESITLSVHNEGNPIPAEEQEHLFEYYYRSTSARESSRQGVGLGLAFVKTAADALNGRVTVESSPEVGTTFGFRFPMWRSDQKSAA